MRAALLAGICLGGCSAAEPPLISPDLIVGDAINAPLTDQIGDPMRGEQVFIDRESGHCILCHAVSGLDAEFQGNIGPDLTTVGDRLSAGQLRLRIVDYQIVRPGTLMPSYYRKHNLHQVGAAYSEATILSAQDIEDIIAYLEQRKVVETDA